MLPATGITIQGGLGGAWLDQSPTTGGFTPLPPATHAEILASVGEAIDAIGGQSP